MRIEKVSIFCVCAIQKYVSSRMRWAARQQKKKPQRKVQYIASVCGAHGHQHRHTIIKLIFKQK